MLRPHSNGPAACVAILLCCVCAGPHGIQAVLRGNAEGARRCRVVSAALSAHPPLLITGDGQGNVTAFYIPEDLLRPLPPPPPGVPLSSYLPG